MNICRVFLTGEPGCGKTTAVRRTCDTLKSRGVKIGGMVSAEIREKGTRVGFSLEDLATGQTGILAHVDQNEGPQVGKYRVNLADIERLGVTAIKRAIHESDVIVVDELGPMELKSMPFILAVEMALATPKHFIGTIHRRATHYLVSAIKTNPAYEILEFTEHNRDELPNQVIRRVQGLK